jgi:hypothetical protein
VLTRTARYKRIGFDIPDRTGIQIGGVVRDKSGVPLQLVTVKRNSSSDSVTTNAAGQYVLGNVPTGSLTLTVLEKGGIERQVKFQVPSDSYDILLER